MRLGSFIRKWRSREHGRNILLASCLLLFYELEVYGQLEPGLSLFVNVEGGGSGYLTPNPISAKPNSLDIHAGCDVEFRTKPRIGINFGVAVGRRSYSEAYEFLGIERELEHRLTEILVRGYVTRTLHEDPTQYWVLCYGVTFALRVNSRVSVADLAGNSGTFDVSEPGAAGVRVGLMHGNKSWLSGRAHIGLMTDLHVVGGKQELYVPWLGRNSFEIGRSRCYFGIVFRYRIARMPWGEVVG